MAVPATIARHESKFPVPPACVAPLLRALAVHCDPDVHATTGPDGWYTIDSLYFDSDDFVLYRLTEEDAAIRCKVRVRSYLSPAGRSSQVKLEVKHKNGAYVTKTSASVDHAQWPAVVADPARAPRWRDAAQQSAFDGFAAEMVRWRVRPQTMVRYERAAFFGRLDDYVRVTLDRRIRSQPHTDASFDVDEAAWLDIDGADAEGGLSPVVMEVKFQRAPPGWMVDILRRFGLQQRSFSKYGHAVRRERSRGAWTGAGGWLHAEALEQLAPARRRARPSAAAARPPLPRSRGLTGSAR